MTKGDYLKFSDGSSKLLSGHKFQEKYVVLQAEKLSLYRDVKVSFYFLQNVQPHCSKHLPTFTCSRGSVSQSVSTEVYRLVCETTKTCWNVTNVTNLTELRPNVCCFSSLAMHLCYLRNMNSQSREENKTYQWGQTSYSSDQQARAPRRAFLLGVFLQLETRDS